MSSEQHRPERGKALPHFFTGPENKDQLDIMHAQALIERAQELLARSGTYRAQLEGHLRPATMALASTKQVRELNNKIIMGGAALSKQHEKEERESLDQLTFFIQRLSTFLKSMSKTD